MLADRVRMCSKKKTADILSQFIKGDCSIGEQEHDGDYKVTIGNDEIYLYAVTKNSYAQVVSNTPIDLSSHKKITISWQGSIGSFGTEGGVIISPNKFGDINDYENKMLVGTSVSSPTERIFDISDIQGSKYIRFFAKGDRSGMMGNMPARMHIYTAVLE